MKSIIKYIKFLENRKTRWQERKFVVEGVRAVEELLKSAKSKFKIIYTQELEKTERGRRLLINLTRQNIEKNLVTEKELRFVSGHPTPAGILALANFMEPDLEEILNLRRPFLLILDGLQDPGNLGTIIRTAEAAGVTGIILSQDTVDHYNPKVVRATMGSILRLPIIKSSNLDSVIDKIKSKNIQVLVCDTRGAKYYYEIEWRLPVALVFGNEAAGPSPEILQRADKTIKIPQRKTVESLNVAVASAIVMYQVVEKAGHSLRSK